MNSNRRSLMMAGLSVLAAGRVLAALPARGTLTLGYLNSTSFDASSEARTLFDAALRVRGYVAGRNLAFEWRFAEYRNERLPALAAELVAKSVDIIVAAGTPCALAAQKATSSIPIIAVGVTAPVVTGMAASLGRPGGNVTGVTNLGSESSTKRLEMLLRLAPATRRVGWLYNPDNPANTAGLTTLEDRGRRFGFELLPIPIRSPDDLERALGSKGRPRVDALFLPLDAILNIHMDAFAAIALRARMASIAGLRQFVTAGGLASHSYSYLEQWRNAADQVDRLAKGAKAGDLPFVQPTQFEISLNRTTAAALGIVIPQDLLLIADHVVG